MDRPSVSDKAHEVMEGWRSDKPVTAIMGEFSSGKSTLINFMLGEDVAATQVTATPLPPIWFTLTDEPFIRGLRRNGEIEDTDFARDVDFREEYAIIHRGLTCPVLAHCDIIDAPGISDPALHKDYLQFLSRYMNYVVWCTPASQAWRQTEKVAYLKLPEDIRKHSFLTITRVDKLRNAKDRTKVHTRVVRDAGDLFADVVSLQTLKAGEVPVEDRTTDERGKWVKAGGHDFEVAFTKAVQATAPADAKTGETKLKSLAGEAAEGGATGDRSVEPEEDKAKAAPGDSNPEARQEPGDPVEGDDVATQSVQQGSNSSPKLGWNLKSLLRRPIVESTPAEQASETPSEPDAPKKDQTAATDITNLNEIAGFIGACLVDAETGLMMAAEGGDGIDLEMAAAANSELVRAKIAAKKLMGFETEATEDILITLDSQLHLIRPLEDTPTVFLYTALEKKTADLALARMQVRKVEKTLSL